MWYCKVPKQNQLMKPIKDLDKLDDRIVLLRLDLNVPILDGK